MRKPHPGKECLEGLSIHTRCLNIGNLKYFHEDLLNVAYMRRYYA